MNGVGYDVTCSVRTLRKIGPAKSPASLLNETHVREDAINHYGFADVEEQDWFRLLTTVQGVGARVALSILSAVSPDELAQVIAAQDKSRFNTSADGVGPKLALRLVTELKDKVPSFHGLAYARLRARERPPMPHHPATCSPAMPSPPSSISAIAAPKPSWLRHLRRPRPRPLRQTRQRPHPRKLGGAEPGRIARA